MLIFIDIKGDNVYKYEHYVLVNKIGKFCKFKERRRYKQYA